MTERIALVANGYEVRRWSRYEVASSLFTPANAFSLAVDGFRPDDLARFGLGSRCQLLVTDEVQLTGRVDGTDSAAGSSGKELEISGRDRAAPLVDCTAPAGRYADRSLIDVAQELLEPWGIVAVTQDADLRLAAAGRAGYTRASSAEAVAAAREKRQDWEVQRGERVWGFLARGAMRAGLVLWMSASGDLVISRPSYDQSPLYELCYTEAGTGNNVIDARRRRSWLRRFSVTTGTALAGRSSVRRKAQIVDQELQDAGIHRPFTTSFDAATDAELGEALARDQALRIWESDELVYTVDGHTQDGVVWHTDTLVQVRDEIHGIDAPMYVVEVKFTLSTESGPRTTLRLRHPGVWLA